MPYNSNSRGIEDDVPVHIIMRAVDGKQVFSDEADCYRFIFQMYAANIGKPNLNLRRADVVGFAKSLLRGVEPDSDLIIKDRAPLVYILDFCLNITHYHFFLLPTSSANLAKFIQKLNIGFAKYFNLKYQRKGPLFISRYKSVVIEDDFQSDAVSRYVSIVNPLDIHQPGWREGGLRDIKAAETFLKDYPFSSFPDKIGLRQSKLLAPKDILEKNGISEYKDFTVEFLEEARALPDFDV